MPPAKQLIADKGYDSNALRDWLKRRGTEPVIPPRSNRKMQLRYDKRLYRERNRIERSFGRLKDFRRIATRFDRNVKNFMAALCLAAVVIWRCYRVRTLDTPAQHHLRIATTRAGAAEAPTIFNGNTTTSKPRGGSASRLHSCSMCQ